MRSTTKTGPRSTQLKFKKARSIDGVSEFAIPILRALGLDLKMVLSFTIHCEPGLVPFITIQRAIPKGSGIAAGHILEQYELVKKGEPTTLADLDESVTVESLIRTTHRVTGSQAPSHK